MPVTIEESDLSLLCLSMFSPTISRRHSRSKSCSGFPMLALPKMSRPQVPQRCFLGHRGKVHACTYTVFLKQWCNDSLHSADMLALATF